MKIVLIISILIFFTSQIHAEIKVPINGYVSGIDSEFIEFSSEKNIYRVSKEEIMKLFGGSIELTANQKVTLVLPGSLLKVKSKSSWVPLFSLVD